MSALGLTPKQKECLEFVRAYLAAHDGTSPSYDEIMAGLGLRSKSGVYRLMHALHERGHIQIAAGRARSAVVGGKDATTLLLERLAREVVGGRPDDAFATAAQAYRLLGLHQ